MVYDMQNNQFPVDLDNVHSVLEIGQVRNIYNYITVLPVVSDYFVIGLVSMFCLWRLEQ